MASFLPAIFPFAIARVFLGMSVASFTVLERREYEVVRGRLLEGPASSSSSELGSGAARFFPLGSRTGSLIVRAG
ncbi:hypothetical protein C8R47DRAFT_1088987 [Mycena vitilis]|nr:hypothetical protein C8R47DRAFT_1088987 [Mycena vitilis]